MSVIGTIMAKLALDITNFSSNLSKVQSDIESTGKKLDGLDKLGGGITSAGKKLTTSLTLPIVGIGTAAVKTATDFEYSMSQVQAISGATGDEFESLKEEAIKLGGSTKFSAGEVADAMTEMAKAGWSTEQILSGMSGVLDAAAASGEGLGTVSTIVADAITGFGMKASDSTKVADLLTQAANAGTIGVNDLGESFKYIAPVAQSLGINIEDATTAISAMSMAGIKGSQAGTSLRTMLTNLVKPTDQMQAAMDELGISVTNQDGSMKSLDEILANLRTSFDGLTDAEKASYAATLAGKQGMSGMLALLNLTQEEYDAISDSMYGSAGVAGETAKVMQDNLKSALEQAGGALESLGIKIGEQLIPMIKSVANWIANFTEKLSGMSDEQIQTGIKVAAFVAALGPVVMAVGKVITSISSLSKAFTAIKSMIPMLKAGLVALKGAIAGISAPVAAVVAVVAVLVAAFVSLWKNNEDFRNKITEIWNQIKATFEKLTGGIVERLNKLGFDFESIGGVLSAIWKGFCDLLAPYFEGVFSYIANYFETIVNVILGVVDFFIALFTGDWQGCWDAIKDIFMSIWNGIVNWFKIIFGVFQGIFDVILGWFGTSWNECWNAIKEFFVNIWNGIVTWFQGVLNGIATFFTNIWTGITTFFQNVWNGIVTFFTNIITGIVNLVQTYFGGMITNIQNIFTGIKDFFVNIWEVIKNFFLGIILVICDLVTGNFDKLKSDVANIFENIKTAFSNIWDAIKTIFSNVIGAIVNFTVGKWNLMKDTVVTVFTAVKTFFSNLWTSIKDGVTTAWNAIKTFFSNAVNNIKTTAVNTFNNIKTSITTTVTGIKDAIVNGFNKAVEWIKALPKQALTWGKDIIQGMIDGIKKMIGKIGDAVEGVAEKIRSFLHFSVPDEGPLTDYETYMPDMIDGFVNSLKKSAPNLYKAAEAVAGGLSNVFGNNGLQAAMAGAYGSVAGGTSFNQNLGDSTSGLRGAATGGTIHIEKIEVRDDEDIEELTQGLYDHNDRSLRAMGRRNL